MLEENKVTLITMDQQNQQQSEKEKTTQINELGSARIKSRRGNISCLSIIGQIEGHMALAPQNKTTKYEHVIPLLVSIEEDDSIDGLLIVLNTVGGDVEAGLAISEMIAGMKKPTVSLVLGGGHSIGVPLAVASKYSFIAPTATMTIHPIRMSGIVIGVPQTFDYFSRMQERVVSFITRHSTVSAEKLRELMLNTNQLANDVGTILFGEDAINTGIIKEIGSISNALDKLYDMIEQNRKE